MSIATELTRLKQAKNDIKTSIENKGVTVDSAATLDTYNTYIDLISGATQENKLNLMLKNQLTEITAEDTDGVVYIDGFEKKTNLQKITFADSVYDIASGCCSGCSSLSSVTFGTSLKKINASAFTNTALVDLVLPSGVTYLGTSAFNSCASLKSVYAKGKIPSLYNYTFAFCTSLSSFTMDYPESVTTINSSVFKGCTSLTAIPLTEMSMTALTTSAFTYCSSLTRCSKNQYVEDGWFVAPTSLTRINAQAFCGCSGITDVSLSENCTGVTTYAFSGSGVQNFYFFKHTYPTFDSTTLKAPSGVTCYVPIDGLSSYTSYKFASAYTSQIKINPYAAPSGQTVYLRIKDLYQASTIKVVNNATPFYNAISSMIVNGTSVTKSPTVSLVAGDSIIMLNLSASSINMEYAFAGCGNVDEVYIGDGITVTGTEEMFQDCGRISNIVFGSGCSAFSDSTFDAQGQEPFTLTLHSPTVVECPYSTTFAGESMNAEIHLVVPVSLAQSYVEGGGLWQGLYDNYSFYIEPRIIE